MNTADRLRQAATKIRETANPANFDPQWQLSDDLVEFGFDREDAQYIALMAPPVALAVADWLDYAAEVQARRDKVAVNPYTEALAVANLILGDTE